MPNKGTYQAVDRREHDLSNEAKRVQVVDAFGGVVTEGNYTQKFGMVGDVLTYIGKAQIGTAESAEEWQIKKLDYDGDDLAGILWANGTDEFTNSWEDRATYSYS
jgi:hypothetical protein